MAVPNSGTCYHCLKTGHWQKDCPLLKPPEDKDHHEARIAVIRWRLGDGEIGPVAKTRMIEKENSLWKAKQKELARK